MAGGKHAARVPCMVCMTDGDRMVEAIRIYEGVEDDQYRCQQGHVFGMDWRRGPATEPQWPPSTDGVEALGTSKA